ncbi:toluene tolerance protein, putative [Ectopseudomonas oleovorans]|uniref:Toluene tolerance protein, putative n=2 Tax=Ectopseudomonas oleovorans TaxID=301 RepID=W6QY52_ECTO5|nr:toluene tolerance protein, putative [Pseudomonas oleovorans CECT 5344]CDR89717.1 toluene tolerance protein, putative [Pseudomonas oleovorans]
MRIVPANELQQWLTQGEVLEKDARGPKVLRQTDGQLLKIFRPRRRLWLARLRPAAQRFASNAERLADRNITTPQISECLWLDPSQAVSACLYSPLPGISLDQLYRRARQEFDALLPELADFIHTLHQRGIYFRSLHLGNILRLPDGGFGLIDFLDMRFKRGPLSARLARRNLEHLRGYLHRSQIADFPWKRLLQAYERQPAAKPVRLQQP